MNLSGGTYRHTPSEAELTVADITERLMEEFGAQFEVSTISRIVLSCRRDLQGSPTGALPELVERLARVRLSQAAVD